MPARLSSSTRPIDTCSGGSADRNLLDLLRRQTCLLQPARDLERDGDLRDDCREGAAFLRRRVERAADEAGVGITISDRLSHSILVGTHSELDLEVLRRAGRVEGVDDRFRRPTDGRERVGRLVVLLDEVELVAREEHDPALARSLPQPSDSSATGAGSSPANGSSSAITRGSSTSAVASCRCADSRAVESAACDLGGELRRLGR